MRAVSEQFFLRLATAPRSLTDEKSVPLFQQFTRNNPPDGDDVHPLSVVRTRYRKFADIDPNTGRPRGFPTPSGRLELYATLFFDAGYAPLPEYIEPVDSPLSGIDQPYPLVLTSFRSIHYIGPQNRNTPRLRSKLPEPYMEIHPDTAESAGIADGVWAILESPIGRVKLKAKYNRSLHPRVVCTIYGWWQECKELGLPGYDPLGPDSANVNNLRGCPR